MFDKLFGKKRLSPPMLAETPRQMESRTSPDISADVTQVWRDKILAADSDDAGLLQLLSQAPSTDLKLEALQALRHEDSLRQAMREFRERDKRLYRAAKSRWQAASDTRVANSEAASLIATARALLDQESIPVNRVVELDRAWAAINAELLDAALRVEFANLSEQLGIKVRAHGTRAQLQGAWLSAVDNAAELLSALLPGVANGHNSSIESEGLGVRLLELLDNVPDASDTRCIAKIDSAKKLLALASNVVQRAQFLQALPESKTSDADIEKSMIEQWRAFPELAEDDKNALHSVLAQRFADWRNTRVDARKLERDAQGAIERERRATQSQQRSSDLQRDIEAAEAAHGSGQVAELARLLAAIDQATKRGSVNAELAQRVEFLRREQLRLRDWQQWSGRQSREQLAGEAQALAQLANGKVNIKGHAEAIATLRERWKALDKLGGESNQDLWLSFDSSLKAAYVPVAAHLDKLKLARQENLAARDQIIVELDAASIKFFPTMSEETVPIAPPDWRAIAHALEQARIAWQKLGPVAHTVPRATLQGDNAVTSRYAAAVQKLESPLKNAYDEARRNREQLIATAKQLIESNVNGRDVIDKVRGLQSQWQQIAKAVPLPRFDENGLWAAFKSATDAIFVARDAARLAGEAEMNARLQAGEAVIERLVVAASLHSAPEIKRAIAEADSAWRGVGDLAKPLRAKLDARYRVALDGVQARLRELTHSASQARFDALVAAMALCSERERLRNSDHAVSAEQLSDLETRWNSIVDLPKAWKTSMDARFRDTGGNGNSPDATTLEALLKLEVDCSIESPNEFLAARQQLKIRALKTALEGRQVDRASIGREDLMLQVAACPYLDDQSSTRLAKVIAVMRREAVN
jgi:DNA repair protein SbcC/Rad50